MSWTERGPKRSGGSPGDASPRPDDADASPLPPWLRRYARMMDSSITIPGTKRTIGIDPLIGLLPGVGDMVSLGMSAVPLVAARRLGVRRRTFSRMAFNVAIDAMIGAIPILGDLWDMWFKANERNLRLLEKDLERRGEKAGPPPSMGGSQRRIQVDVRPEANESRHPA